MQINHRNIKKAMIFNNINPMEMVFYTHTKNNLYK